MFIGQGRLLDPEPAGGGGSVDTSVASTPAVESTPSVSAVDSSVDMKTGTFTPQGASPRGTMVNASKALGLSKPAKEVVKDMAATQRQKGTPSVPFTGKDQKKEPEKTLAAAQGDVLTPEPEVKPPAEVPPVVPPAPVVEAPKPQTIKWNGKEYTAEQWQAILDVKEAHEAQMRQQQQTEQANAPKMSPQEEAAQTRQYEHDWISNNAEAVDLNLGFPQMTEEQRIAAHEAELGGGIEGVKVRDDIRRRDILHAQQGAVREVARQANPVMKKMEDRINQLEQALEQRIAPLQEHHQQLAKYEFEQGFYTANPALKARSGAIRTLDAQLQKEFPGWYAKATKDQIYTQLKDELKKADEYFAQTFGYRMPEDTAQANGTPAPAVVPPVAPAPGNPAAQRQAASAAAMKKATPPAPGANTSGSGTRPNAGKAVGNTSKDFQRSAVASMRALQ